MSQKSTLTFLVFFFFYSNVFAESTSRSYNPSSGSVRGQVARIMMSGLGGAVFGVSTLSFYGEPQKHLSNVALGAAIGLLIGSAYVTSEALNEDYSYSYTPDNFTNSNQTNSLANNSRGSQLFESPFMFVWSKEF
jgi:hypothetical protein